MTKNIVTFLVDYFSCLSRGLNLFIYYTSSDKKKQCLCGGYFQYHILVQFNMVGLRREKVDRMHGRVYVSCEGIRFWLQGCLHNGEKVLLCHVSHVYRPL